MLRLGRNGNLDELRLDWGGTDGPHSSVIAVSVSGFGSTGMVAVGGFVVFETWRPDGSDWFSKFLTGHLVGVIGPPKICSEVSWWQRILSFPQPLFLPWSEYFMQRVYYSVHCYVRMFLALKNQNKMPWNISESTLSSISSWAATCRLRCLLFLLPLYILFCWWLKARRIWGMALGGIQGG